jgi:hypothetical protein
MTSIVDSSVHIHTSAEPSPCLPPWFGEFVLVVTRLKKHGASIRSCRPCPLRDQCQWNGSATAKPRQVRCCFIRSWSGVNPSDGMTGVAGFIGMPAFISFATNAWRCRWNRMDRPPLLPLFHLRLFPAHSGRILVSRGTSGWLAMFALHHLSR